MGILSKLLLYVVAKRTEEAITEKVTEEMQEKTNPQNKKLFNSRKEVGTFLLGYIGITQGLSVWASMMVVLASFETANPIGAAYSTYVIATFLSCVLFILGVVFYGLYLIDFWPILVMVAAPLLFFLMTVFFEYGFIDSLKFFISSEWMPPVMKLAFFLIGVVVAVSGITIACYNESRGTKKKIQKQAIPTISDEDAEKNRNLLRTAIQENAIRVQFSKGQWGFTVSTKVLFGYDNKNKQFVFVSNKCSEVIEAKRVVYLDYEDLLYGSDSGTTEYQRLIKLFYLGNGNEEHIISLLQWSLEDMCDNHINKIKQYANKYPTDVPEIKFRRKIRHLASSLEADLYPNRPFLNDTWFDFLKANMEKIKNNNNDGYTLFRNKLIANDDYWGDDTLFTIIEDLSQNPPNPSTAKKEAKKLCFRDFGATLGHNIKSIFQNNE